jgi:photosystem II stability/assembly factor-like uncharacterized protein
MGRWFHYAWLAICAAALGLAAAALNARRSPPVGTPCRITVADSRHWEVLRVSDAKNGVPPEWYEEVHFANPNRGWLLARVKPRVRTYRASGYSSSESPEYQGARLLETRDGGKTWRTINSSPIPAYAYLFARGQVVWFVRRDLSAPNGDYRFSFFRTADGGRTWARSPSQPPYFAHITPISRDEAWGNETEEALSHTTDGGATWQTMVLPPSGFHRFVDMTSAFLDKSRGWVVIAVDTPNRQRPLVVYRTTDGGKTFQLSRTPASPQAYLVSLCVPSPRDLWIATGSETLLRSVDGGTTWQVVTLHVPLPPGSGGDTGVTAASFPASAEGWVAGERINTFLWHTRDSGKTWVSEAPNIRSAEKLSAWQHLSVSFERIVFLDTTHGWLLGSAYIDPDYERPHAASPFDPRRGRLLRPGRAVNFVMRYVP